MEEAADKLAASLNSYSEAAHRASQPESNAELETAYKKVELARKFVLEGRLANALGQCLPEHVRHWPAWSHREDFQNWVGFDATDIAAKKLT